MALEERILELIKQIEEEKRLADKRAKQLYNLFTPGNWTAPSLLNSWVDYGTPFASTGYFKDAFGLVHLRGVVKSGTIGQAIFQLPTGYRPANALMFVVTSYDGSNYVHGRCDVQASGNVMAVAGNNNIFSICGITFRKA